MLKAGIRQLSVWSLCCLSSLLWLPFAHAQAQAETQSQVDNVLVLGDSLSAGFGMSVEESWPSLLQQRLREQGYRCQVVNASISGATSSEGLAQVRGGLLSRTQPKLVVLELGANDGLRGLSLMALKKNLGDIVASAQQQGAEVLVLGMKLPPNYGRRYNDVFERVFSDVSTQYSAALLPFFLQPVALNEALILPDGLHPTAKAQPLLLDAVWPLLKPLLAACDEAH